MKPFAVLRLGEDLEAGAISTINVSANKGIAVNVGSTAQATVSVTLNGDGTITYDGTGTPGAWHNAPAAGLGASFWAIVTLTAGTVTTGTTASRVALTNGQAWTIVTTGTGNVRTKSVTGTIQLWDAVSGGNMVSSGTFSLFAQVQAAGVIDGGGGQNSDGSVTINEFYINEQF
jgi:hypothetical protein